MHVLPGPFADAPAVVAIPVQNEAERIADCLLALSNQAGPAPGVLLLVNNTTDATVRLVAEIAPSLACPVHVIEHRFPPDQANAGMARRLAMQRADELAPPGVPLLTSDADGRADPDWLRANLHHLGRDIDAVFGRADIDPIEAASIPPSLHQADAEECAYAALLDQIASLIDPDPHDPWPRHAERSGASIAVRRSVFRAVGGIPAVALGEDRGFHAVLRRADARVRHAPEVRVVVSGRILGRAAGGMADTIRRRLVAPDTMLDSALEPTQDRARRLRQQRALRLALRDGTGLPEVAAATGLSPSEMKRASFGACWAAIEERWPMARVRVVDLPEQMALALRIRDALLERAGELTVAA